MSKAMIEKLLDQHFAMRTAMGERVEVIGEISELIWQRFKSGGRLYAFGNGGSAAEAQHFVGELIGHYALDREPLPAVALNSDAAVLSCIANDYAFEDIFARQVKALVGANDLAVGFSTSGTSKNVIAALDQAKTNGASTVLFTGSKNPLPESLADVVFVSPSSATARVQEMHQLAMHIICEFIDEQVENDLEMRR